MKGRFLILDGLDGIGKGVYLDAMEAAARENELRIFDLHQFWKEHGRHPTPKEVGNVDLLLSSEPTYVGWGKQIREELIKKGTSHTAREIAEAYANDRMELYKEVILPAREKGIAVIQSRGVTTSLVYQPLDAARKGESLSWEEVEQLPGNAFCLRAAALPDAIIIPRVSDVKEVIDRLNKRKKQDDATFETYEFQLKVKEVFDSQLFTEFFTARGVKVIFADAETSVAFSQQEARRLFSELLKN
jgi:thymidylate kinase